MQVETRAVPEGVLDPTEIDFHVLYARGLLISPDVPGKVLANLVLKADASLRGGFYSALLSQAMVPYGGTAKVSMNGTS